MVLAYEWSGPADRRAAVSWSARTASQIASISKQFVAVVSLLAVDQGLLGLDDAVATLLPEAPAQWRAVTLKHLLTHTSGLPHWCERPGFDPAIVLEPEQRLEQLLDAPLDGEPGAVWRYSSPGYIVLSAVLERATGRAYSDLARELIIDKLALSGTTIGSPPSDQVARGYRDGQDVPPWDLSTMPGTGDVWSTALDVAAFITALHEGTGCATASRRQSRISSARRMAAGDRDHHRHTQQRRERRPRTRPGSSRVARIA